MSIIFIYIKKGISDSCFKVQNQNDTIVSLGIQNCDIIYLSSSEINCITPSVFVSHYGNITAINGIELDLNLTNWISSVDIIIDSITYDYPYIYEKSITPIVNSISPSNISSVSTTTIEIIGNGFLENTTVTIADQTCHIEELYFDLIICILIRSKGIPVSEVPVYVNVPGIGYASESSNIITLPIVNFGFEIY